MIIMKQGIQKKIEVFGLIFIYVLLFVNAVFFKDSIAALISAFFGITYTILAGKGRPYCYLFGLMGSGFYVYLAFRNALWGNLILYAAYYIPMQILGFFRWQKHLKSNKSEIIKISLKQSERIRFMFISFLFTILTIIILIFTGDKSPFIDGITTVFSVIGMYLTVKRCIEQWLAWIIVNGLSSLMWLSLIVQGTKAYSTLLMWIVYFILGIYFFFVWKKEMSISNNNL